MNKIRWSRTIWESRFLSSESANVRVTPLLARSIRWRLEAYPVEFQYIDQPDRLNEFCARIRKSQVVAFDTEFISEDCFRPELCLIQVAVDGELVLIDGVRLGDCRPFWQALVDGSARAVTHAARAEFLFGYLATERSLERLFDTQIAAGFSGMEFPASYSNLVQRLVKKPVGKTETRSDWRRRPLSQQQIEYALQDVVYLPPMYSMLSAQLQQLGREPWMEQEMRDWQAQVIDTEFHEPWRRLSGFAGLTRRGMAIAIGLWQWREQSASRRNVPMRRVLRDDLLIELARRETSKISEIRLLRGMERQSHSRDLTEIAAAVAAAIGSGKETWPMKPPRPASTPDLNLLGQFLYSAFSIVCRNINVAAGLVGSVQDVRNLAAWHLGLSDSADPPPRLARGWRGEVVGATIQEMLLGKWAITVDRPLLDQPLRLINVGDETS